MFKIKNQKPKTKNTNQKPKILNFAVSLFYILILVSCVSWVQAQEREVATVKKAVMIIAHAGFRDEEFLQPKEILEKGGIKVMVASSSLTEATGMLGAKVKPDILISDIKIDDYQAIIFIGGSGASEYWDNPTAHKLAKDANTSGKIVGAICIAPVTLANAGILEGKKATVWKSESQQLFMKGARYTGRKVERDGNIITADGPIASDEFGNALLQAISGTSIEEGY